MRYTINQKVFVGFPFHIIISVTILMYATAPPPPTFLNIQQLWLQILTVGSNEGLPPGG